MQDQERKFKANTLFNTVCWQYCRVYTAKHLAEKLEVDQFQLRSLEPTKGRSFSDLKIAFYRSDDYSSSATVQSSEKPA